VNTTALLELVSFEKGGERLGDEESSEEEKEVTPASILASGARPLAPDVIESSAGTDFGSQKHQTVSNDLGGLQGDA
jgi:hypothetical protein